MLAAQGGCCAICRMKPETLGRRFTVDHAHADPDEPARGILCSYCNTAIGLFGEDIELIHNAIGYIQSHQVSLS